jgi:uncharacterized membrane protein YfcA
VPPEDKLRDEAISFRAVGSRLLGKMDFAELLGLATAILAAGVVTGLLAGLFGIGGGAVIVPVLYEVFRLSGVPEAVRMQLCIGTSLAIIVPTAWRSYRAHRARRLVLPEVLQVWTLPAIAGVALGSLAAALAPAEVFKAAFIVHSGLRRVRRRVRGSIAPETPGREEENSNERAHVDVAQTLRYPQVDPRIWWYDRSDLCRPALVVNRAL